MIVSEYGGHAERVWTDAADSADLKRRIEGLPGFGDMKVRSLTAVLAKRLRRRELAKEIAPDHPTLGDVDSPEALEEYQAKKRAYKAAVRAGQPGSLVAATVHVALAEDEVARGGRPDRARLPPRPAQRPSLPGRGRTCARLAAHVRGARPLRPPLRAGRPPRRLRGRRELAAPGGRGDAGAAAQGRLRRAPRRGPDSRSWPPSSMRIGAAVELAAPGPHWHLRLLAVDPAVRAAALGASLLEHGLRSRSRRRTARARSRRSRSGPCPSTSATASRSSSRTSSRPSAFATGCSATPSPSNRLRACAWPGADPVSVRRLAVPLALAAVLAVLAARRDGSAPAGRAEVRGLPRVEPVEPARRHAARRRQLGRNRLVDRARPRAARRLRLGPLGRRPDRHPDHRRVGEARRRAASRSTTPTRATRARTRSRRTSRSRAAASRTATGTRSSSTARRCKLYELYALYPQGGGWKAGSGAIWSLNSNRLRPSGWTSADAAGLPIFPGLARYDEVKRGRDRPRAALHGLAHAQGVRLAGAALRERRTPTRRCRRWGCASG